MAYPSRPTLETLPEFLGTDSTRQTPGQRRHLIEFVRNEYDRGRSLRELGELTGRTQTAIRRAAEQGGVRLRPPGAPELRRGAAD